MTTFTVQVPARRATGTLPGELIVGSARLEIDNETATRQGRHRARWTKGLTEGKGYVEIRPTSKLTSEVVVALEAPSGIIGKIRWLTSGMSRLAELFAEAVRYEIETRSVEEADGFDVRRTTPELVRARSA